MTIFVFSTNFRLYSLYFIFITLLFIHRDNVPTVELAAWPLEASLFDGDIAAEPVPLIFSEEPDSSWAALESNMAKAHADLQKVARCFYMPETIHLEDALNLVKKRR
jgi:hypothetical protein